MTAVYIHIPFCKRRCSYCDFITYAHLDTLLPDYLQSLQREIEHSSFDVGPVETLYFGGGTPSLMIVEQVDGVLKAVRSRFGIHKDAEITIEANPGTVDQVYFEGLRRLGINRLSMGVQSFNEQELKVLGRIHNSWEALESFHEARKAGFGNISLDFIFGLPEQDMAAWRHNLEKISLLKPEHLSIYSLILEPGTLLTRWVEKGLVNLPDDDLVADMFEETLSFLERQGYGYYEISSWALGKTRESRHNKVYWKGQDYLGFGAGAVGNVGGLRWRNTPNVKEYLLKLSNIARRYEESLPDFDGENVQLHDIKQLQLGPAVVETEALSLEEQMQEMMMLGLRMTHEGVSADAFRQRFGQDLKSVFADEIRGLIAKGLVEWVLFENGYHLVMTKKGVFLGNQVFKVFI